MKTLLITITAIVLLSSCYYDKEENLYGATCDTSAVTYNASIVPVLASNCISCHGGAFPSGNVKLDTYTDVRTVAMNGKLYGSISHSTGFFAMPQNAAQLSNCTISKFKIWISNGAPNN
jgi:hypothetical protein